MVQQAQQWILPASINVNMKDGSEEQVLDSLIELAEKTHAVTDRKQLWADVREREVTASTAIDEEIILPHAKSEGVSSFCAAIGIARHKKIYLLTAWKETTHQELKKIAALIEIFKEQENKRVALNAQDSMEVFELLQKKLKKYGIAI